MTTHLLAAGPTYSRWSRDLAPRLAIRSGDAVEFECLDSSSGGQVESTSTVEDFVRIDHGRIRALTGPVCVEGAQPGEVLAPEILDVSTADWGWTGILLPVDGVS